MTKKPATKTSKAVDPRDAKIAELIADGEEMIAMYRRLMDGKDKAIVEVRAERDALKALPYDPEAAQHIEDSLIGGYIRECQAKQPGATTVDLSRLEAIRTGIRLVLA